MNKDVVAVLLAGGLSRRMGGGDKCLRMLAGRSMLARVIDRVQPQAGQLILNANGDPERFAEFGLPVAPDVVEGFAGPLAGVLTGMDWAAANAPDCPWVVTLPTDAPFLPQDLVTRLVTAVQAEGAEMACAASDGRSHPPIALWPVALREDLRKAMLEEEMRKVDRWTARYKLAVAAFDSDPVDPFFNANKAPDLDAAETLLASHPEL